MQLLKVNLVNPERTKIKSEYIVGLSQHQKEQFMKEAVHSLKSTDIQADIVKSKEIEVPELNDSRFDPLIFKRYGHELMVRAYIPMIEPLSNQVIGTVEVGYKKANLPYIYEQDIQILKSFVDNAVYALERLKSGLIDRIAHECKSPIVSIRSNASFIQRRISDLGRNRMTIKLNDILSDCNLLLHQVKRIEYAFGRQGFQKPKFKKVVVFRDVIIKTIYPIISGMRFPNSSIEYDRADSNRIIVYTDKAMLNQVVYNIIVNAIKYAEKDPSQFKIVLKVDEDKDNFIIKFQDYGIGIKREYQQKIFDQGFRSPEAIARDVTGSGLGLFISRNIMRQLGGDLKLGNNAKPTEFQLILPKLMKEVANDSFR